MSTDIQKIGNPWLEYGNAATARSIVGTLLKFSKGDYPAGMDDRTIPIGTEMVPNHWDNGMPTEQRMGLVADGFVPAKRCDLGDIDQELWESDAEGRPRDPWQLSNYLIMFAKDGMEVFTFATSSRGGLNAIGELCKTYGKQMRQRPVQFPVIELAVGSYPHREKSFGRIKFPIFKVIGWTDKGPYADPIGDDTPPTATSSDNRKAAQVEPPEAKPTAKRPKIENAATRF